MIRVAVVGLPDIGMALSAHPALDVQSYPAGSAVGPTLGKVLRGVKPNDVAFVVADDGGDHVAEMLSALEKLPRSTVVIEGLDGKARGRFPTASTVTVPFCLNDVVARIDETVGGFPGGDEMIVAQLEVDEPEVPVAAAPAAAPWAVESDDPWAVLSQDDPAAANGASPVPTPAPAPAPAAPTPPPAAEVPPWANEPAAAPAPTAAPSADDATPPWATPASQDAVEAPPLISPTAAPAPQPAASAAPPAPEAAPAGDVVPPWAAPAADAPTTPSTTAPPVANDAPPWAAAEAVEVPDSAPAWATEPVTAPEPLVVAEPTVIPVPSAPEPVAGDATPAWATAVPNELTPEPVADDAAPPWATPVAEAPNVRPVPDDVAATVTAVPAEPPAPAAPVAPVAAPTPAPAPEAAPPWAAAPTTPAPPVEATPGSTPPWAAAPPAPEPIPAPAPEPPASPTPAVSDAPATSFGSDAPPWAAPAAPEPSAEPAGFGAAAPPWATAAAPETPPPAEAPPWATDTPVAAAPEWTQAPPAAAPVYEQPFNEPAPWDDPAPAAEQPAAGVDLATLHDTPGAPIAPAPAPASQVPDWAAPTSMLAERPVEENPTFAHARYADQEEMRPGARLGKVLAVVAAKGGAGKSTLSLWTTEAIGAALRGMDRKVALVDANIGQPDISKMMRLWGQTPDLGHIADGRRFTTAELHEALVEVEELNATVLFGPKSPIKVSEEASLRALSSAVRLLRREYSWIILDAPVGTIFEDVYRDFLLHEADLLLVVVNPHEPTIQDTASFLNEISQPVHMGGMAFPSDKAAIVLNKSTPKSGLTLADVERRLPEYRVLGEIPEVQSVIAAVNDGVYQAPTAAASVIAQIVATVTGEAVGVDEAAVNGRGRPAPQAAAAGWGGRLKRILSKS